MSIITNILNEAKKRKLSDQDLCKILNTHKSKIYDWKKGRSEPSAEEVKILSDYFSISTDYLLGISEIPNPELLIPDELKNVQIAFNRGEFEDLSQDEVDKLAEFARFIKLQRKE